MIVEHFSRTEFILCLKQLSNMSLRSHNFVQMRNNTKSADVKSEPHPSPKKVVKRKIKSENKEVTEDDPVPKKKVKREKTTTTATKGKASSKQSSGTKFTTTPVSWKVEDVIGSCVGVQVWAAKNVVKLLDEGCTIPFIARYRKEQTGGMEVQKLRETLTTLEELRTVETKVKQAKSTILEQGKMTPGLDTALSNAQTLPEVECLFAPFKPGSKGTLAERARALGLEQLAIKFLNGHGTLQDANRFVDSNSKGLTTVAEIMEGVKHILADVIHKDTEVVEKIRYMTTHNAIQLHSSRTKAKKTEVKPGVKVEPAEKYQNYFDFSNGITRIQPHQVLAINRGENHKILSVKIVIPEFLKHKMMELCTRKWLYRNPSPDSGKIIHESIEDAYNRLIQPQLTRAIRSNLTKKAEKLSIDVFASNVKNLLLSAPLKGHTILAIDPGFTNGCKTAVISETGQILATEVVYIHSRKADMFKESRKMEGLILSNKCDVVAIGNGTACRETETFIAEKICKPFPNVKYCIVDECGASIYSVSDIAQKEMPDLDPTLRGAVSIGRRLLDPLAEFVKSDPKHLGVGQYQHDMPQNQLKASLDSTVEECVSFVGVDINTCSECLLSRVSGLSTARAKNIIEWRAKFGAFVCREQLLSVKGLGAKSYEQAAGFVRIHSLNGPNTTTTTPSSTKTTPAKGKKGASTKSKKKSQAEYLPNPLDMTWIHPESYNLTSRFVDMVSADISHLGQTDFIQKVQQYLNKNSIKEIAGRLDCGEPTVSLITTALLRPLSYDLREEFEKPLFKNSVKSMDNLKVGHKVTGRVSNVTHFGAFVDIGVERNGLVHVSKMYLQESKKKHNLQIGEKIEVEIDSFEKAQKRIGLRLLRVL